MQNQPQLADRPPMPVAACGDILAVSFGTAVVMWGAGYFARIPLATDPPSVLLPNAVLLFVLVAIQLAGGFVLGARTDRGVGGAILTGVAVSAINLLVLGSLVAEGHDAGQTAVAVGGFLGGTVLLTLIGWAIGRTRRPHAAAEHPNWTGVFAKVAVGATFLLIVAGGMVTGWEAGLAVPDWPNTEGALMFLYPLSRMTGGVYYEHAHRLLGALVGLTTLALCVHLWIARGVSQRVRWFAVCALALVIAQGILGGLRVTGRFTTATAGEELAPNTTLAVVHGVTAQIFLGVMTALAVFLSTTWRNGPAQRADDGAGLDRKLSILALVLLFVQLLLGATYRHLNADPEHGPGVIHILYTHMGFAAILLGVLVLAGLRAGRHDDLHALARTGKGLMHTVGLQLLLGIGAFVAIIMRGDATTIPAWEVWTTTAHQATGAALIALATMLVLWTRRFLRPTA